ncbi:peroxiredoxin, partial [cyanobacterium TDX16]
PLLSDGDGEVAKLMGVKRGLAGLSPLKRTTFVIGTDSKVVEKITSELRMNLHADKALDALKASA